jgi:hypothetical protein
MVDPDIFFVDDRMKLKYRLVGTGELQLRGAAVVIRPPEQFESELLVKFHMLAHVSYNDFDMVNLRDHVPSPLIMIGQ